MIDWLGNIACADKKIMENCSNKTRTYYAVLGLMLIALLSLTASSFLYVLNFIPPNLNVFFVVKLFLSILLGGTIFNYYRFVFSNLKLDLRFKKGNGNQDDLAVFITSLIRYSFFTFIAFMIAKGIELYIYESSIDKIITRLHNDSDNQILGLLAGLEIPPEKLGILKANGILSRHLILKGLLGEKTWFTTIAIIILYLIPLIIYSKFNDFRTGEYPRKEWQQSRAEISAAHKITEQHLKVLFRDLVNVDYKEHSNYKNPPFNTKPKPLTTEQIL